MEFLQFSHKTFTFTSHFFLCTTCEPAFLWKLLCWLARRCSSSISIYSQSTPSFPRAIFSCSSFSPLCVSGCMLFGLYNSCRSREAPTSAMNESAPKSFYSWDREWSWGWWWRIPLKILYPNVSVFGFSASFKFKGMRTEDRQPIWNESETSIRFYIPADGWTGVSLLYSGWDWGPLVVRIIYLHFTSKETDRQTNSRLSYKAKEFVSGQVVTGDIGQLMMLFR